MSRQCPKRPKRPKRTHSDSRARPSETSVRISLSRDSDSSDALGRQDRPGYLAAVLRLANNLPPGGGIHHVAVDHDHTCALLNHSGPCDCEAEVRLLRHS
jgi:hypothetical protein